MIIYNENGELNPDIKDVLSELSNVGAGMASIALGKILGMRVTIEAPSVIAGEDAISGITGLDPERIAVGILMTLERTLGGTVLFIINKDFICDAVRIMTGKESADDITEDEDSLSAVQELASIMAASCVKAFGDYTKLRIYLSPTMIGVDMIGALVAFPLAQFELNGCKAICVETRFSLTDSSRKSIQNGGRIIIIPDEASVIKLMNALGL